MDGRWGLRPGYNTVLEVVYVVLSWSEESRSRREGKELLTGSTDDIKGLHGKRLPDTSNRAPSRDEGRSS